jgi:hypothetical protein
MMISLMLLLSNSNLLANAIVAPDGGQAASGYVISNGQPTETRFVPANVEVARSPDEWPIAL